MKKVLLLFPSFNNYAFGKNWKKSESITPPLGLLYLAAPLKKEGYNVKFVDLTCEYYTRKEFNNMIKQQDYILITCFTQSINNVCKIIKDVKELNKKAKVLCGGPYCTETRNFVEGSDLTVTGEAEQEIVKILECFKKPELKKQIPGLIYKEKGRVKKNPGMLQVKDLNSSFIPLLELVKESNYGFINGVRIGKVAPIISSRGCPFQCTYCTYKMIKYRERSVSSVIEELKLRKKQGYKYFLFCDDNFLVKKDRVHEIMNRILKEEMNIKIIIQGRVDNASLELYNKMRRAGVLMIIFGIESANQDILNFYNKSTTVQAIKKAVNIANKTGIITTGSFIIGAPIETKKHFEKNKEFFKNEPLDFLNLNVLRYIKGSRLWKEALNKGLINENEINVTVNEKLCNFTTEELKIVEKDYMKSFYTPRRIMRIIKKIILLGESKRLLQLIELFFKKGIYRTANNRYDYDKKSSVEV